MPRIRLAAYYLAVFLGLGAVLPFLPLVFEARGFSAREVGLLLVIGPCANLVAPPAWAWLADTFGIRARLMSLAPLGCALGVLLLIVDRGVASAVTAMVVYSVCRGPIVPMADAAAHAELGHDASGFARIRVWGSVGFVTGALALGALEGSGRAVMLFGSAAAAYVLAAAIATRRKVRWQPRQTGVALMALREARARGLVGLFAGGVFYYFGHGSYDAFIGLHLRSLGFGDEVVGLAWAAGVVVEIGLMLVIRPVIQRVAGAKLLVVAGVASVVRWSLLSWVTSAEAIIAVQSLHAVTFGLWYLAMVGYVQARASESLRTTIQALAHASMACGMVVGYTVGGAVFERSGGALLFRLGAGAAVMATLAYATLPRDT